MLHFMVILFKICVCLTTTVVFEPTHLVTLKNILPTAKMNARRVHYVPEQFDRVVEITLQN